MKAMAWTLLTTLITGLMATLSGMYTDVQSLKATEPMQTKQLNRIETKLDTITDYLINKDGVRIEKRSK